MENKKSECIKDIIYKYDLSDKNKDIDRILKVAWDNYYNLGQIETIKITLQDDLEYYQEKCMSDLDIIKEIIEG